MSKEAAMAVAIGNPVPTLVPPIVDTPKEPEADALVSSRIAQIAKKESRYQEEMQKFKAEQAEFQKQKAEHEPFAKHWKEFQELKSKDPVAAIKHLGLSDTDFINFVAAQEDKSTPEEKASKIVQAELAKFRQEQEDKEKQATTQRHSETIDGFKKNIDITVKTNADKFEFCNFYGEAAQELIYETVNEAFKEDILTNPEAQPMTAAAAAELVEQYYEEKWKEMGNLKKAKPIEEPIEEPMSKKDEPIKAEVSSRPSTPPKTLTNRVAPSTPASQPPKSKETHEQKRQRLIDALRSGVVK